MNAVKVLLDTDIGTDIDDAVCLAYLLMEPRCELMGITTVTGEADKRAMLASVLCKAAGKAIPIHAGADRPLLHRQSQPTAQQATALERWPHEADFPLNQAVLFLRETIRAHPGEITLLTIGPLTNIGLLFALDPEIPTLLKELVMMCGVFNIPGVIRETNAVVDPHATGLVFRAEVSRLVTYGLNVTLRVQMPADDVRARFSHPLLRPVLDFAEVWFKEVSEITFHDPLAAVSLFRPEICQYEQGSIGVELYKADQLGRTFWNPRPDGKHTIATDVDAAAFFEHFFAVFQE